MKIPTTQKVKNVVIVIRVFINTLIEEDIIDRYYRQNNTLNTVIDRRKYVYFFYHQHGVYYETMFGKLFYTSGGYTQLSLLFTLQRKMELP